MLVIQASNIHTGGGQILLSALVKSCSDLKINTVIFADARFIAPAHEAHVKVRSVRPTIFSRLKVEWELFKLKSQNPIYLFFGNLPPLLPLGTNTNLYFHNVNLLEAHGKADFPLNYRIKHAVEKFWLCWGLRYVQNVFVQTSSVQNLLRKKFPNSQPQVFAFMGVLPKKLVVTPKAFDFVYVSSGDAHKNHTRLFEAWMHLSRQQVFPSLVVTVSEAYPDLLKEIDRLQKAGLKITNKSYLHFDDILALYQQSQCLIFPSLNESFGLPLLEASHQEMPILAPELDYVRDIVEPVETFDPTSSISICRAVLRYMKSEKARPKPVHIADDFIAELTRSDTF